MKSREIFHTQKKTSGRNWAKMATSSHWQVTDGNRCRSFKIKDLKPLMVTQHSRDTLFQFVYSLWGTYYYRIIWNTAIIHQFNSVMMFVLDTVDYACFILTSTSVFARVNVGKLHPACWLYVRALYEQHPHNIHAVIGLLRCHAKRLTNCMSMRKSETISWQQSYYLLP